MIFLFTPAALAIVKEVANHANDIMKHGVRANSQASSLFSNSMVIKLHACC